MVKSLINPQSPFINGDGSYSHCFTCIDNVIQANEPAVIVSKENIINKCREYKLKTPEFHQEEDFRVIILRAVEPQNDPKMIQKKLKN